MKKIRTVLESLGKKSIKVNEVGIINKWSRRAMFCTTFEWGCLLLVFGIFVGITFKKAWIVSIIFALLSCVAWGLNLYYVKKAKASCNKTSIDFKMMPAIKLITADEARATISTYEKDIQDINHQIKMEALRRNKSIRLDIEFTYSKDVIWLENTFEKAGYNVVDLGKALKITW